MNAWFDRVREAAIAELGDEALAGPLTLTAEEAKTLLDLARDAAHGSGARQFAPLLTYLAGRLVQTQGSAERDRIFAVLSRAVAQAGPAGDDAPAP